MRLLFLLLAILFTSLFTSCEKKIDGIQIKKFISKTDYLSEGKLYLNGLDGRPNNSNVAEFYFNKAKEFDKKDSTCLILLNSALEKNKNYKEAEKNYLEYLQISPFDLNIKYLLAQLFINLNEKPKAIDTLSDCMKISLENEKVKPFLPCANTLSALYLAEQSYDKALDVYKDEIQLIKKRFTLDGTLKSAPQYSNEILFFIYLNIAKTYELKKDKANALKFLDAGKTFVKNRDPNYKYIIEVENRINKK